MTSPDLEVGSAKQGTVSRTWEAKRTTELGGKETLKVRVGKLILLEGGENGCGTKKTAGCLRIIGFAAMGEKANQPGSFGNRGKR